MKTALIIEDVPQTRNWLASLLVASFPGIDIETVATVEQGLRAIGARNHDIALIDLGLPDGCGVDCVMQRSKRWPGSPSVVSTSFEDDKHLFLALKAGALGYLLKDQDDEEIIQLLKGVSAGAPPLSPIIAQKMMRHFVGNYSDITQADFSERLTPSEQKVLAQVARGLTVPETAKALGKSKNTVSTQLKSIYAKLNVSSRAEVARLAVRLGIV